jgi:hypothetical protein
LPNMTLAGVWLHYNIDIYRRIWTYKYCKMIWDLGFTWWCLLGRDTEWSDRKVPTFQENLLLPSSYYQTIWYHIPEHPTMYTIYKKFAGP